MPQSLLSRERLEALLPTPLTDRILEDLLFASTAEVTGSVGDELTISVTPDRLDLLSEGGLGLYLQGVLGVAHGIPKNPPAAGHAKAPSFRVDGSVDPIRPAIAGALVRAPDDAGLDTGTLAEAIRVQEILHSTVGRDRRAASLGIYPWDVIEPPVRYSLEPLADVAFVPLSGDTEVRAERFFADHPMAERYGALGRAGDRCLVLRDRTGAVLSLPPVLNARAAGEARVGHRELLIEATGRESRPVREAVGLLLVVFAARGWSVSPVAVEGPGARRDDGRAAVEPHPIDLPSALVRAVAGEPLASSEVLRRLGRCRLGGHATEAGWRAEAPPWRPDLLSPIEVAEDVYLAAPVAVDAGVVPASRTVGRRRAETLYRRRFAERLIGLGLTAPHTSLFVSSEIVARVRGPEPIRLRNPVSAEFAYVRDRLFLSHLEILHRNTRHGYPQQFGEVGPVLVRAPSAESGGQTRYRASFMIASESAGFADVAARVDYLLGGLDVAGVREPAEVAGAIPGRAARLRVAGEAAAEMGEVHPRILTELGVPVPVAFAELDLSALWPLVVPRDGR